MAERGGPESDDDPFAHTRMTLGEHLDELRKRLWVGAVALAVAFGVAMYFSDPITAFMLGPFHESVAMLNAKFEADARAIVAAHPELTSTYFTPDGAFRLAIEDRLVALAPTESMWFVLKVAGYCALFFGAPVLLWQLWLFISAGLYPRERRWVWYFLPPALVLFVLGVAFSFLFLVPYGMYYTQQSVPITQVRPSLSIGFYFDFLFTLCMGMGAVFQLPMLMTFVSLVGLVQGSTFASMRGYFVVAAFVVAAFLTPGPDVFSQVVMAAPMIVLYEIGILGARYAGRRRVAARERSA
jgi:sec-independent protein translocase protein TatC